MKSIDLEALAGTWADHLRDEGKSANTIRTYTASVRGLARWQRAYGKQGLHPAAVRGHIASILDGGGSRNTADTRVRSLQAFFRWLAAEGIIDGDLTVSGPSRSKSVARRLTSGEVNRLLAACSGDDYFSIRDRALVRLMCETGPRCDEILGMQLPGDLNMAGQLVTYRKTKGGKPPRTVPFFADAAHDLARYLEIRQSRARDCGPAWVSLRGIRLSYDGLYKQLGRRALAARIQGWHPHRTRRTAADMMLRKGISEGSVMVLLGWTSREMLDLYVEDGRPDLAIEEARKCLA